MASIVCPYLCQGFFSAFLFAVKLVKQEHKSFFLVTPSLLDYIFLETTLVHTLSYQLTMVSMVLCFVLTELIPWGIPKQTTLINISKISKYLQHQVHSAKDRLSTNKPVLLLLHHQIYFHLHKKRFVNIQFANYCEWIKKVAKILITWMVDSEAG